MLSRCNSQVLENIRTTCEGSLLAFTALFFMARLGQSFRFNWHHRLVVGALENVYAGNVGNLLITMPPGGTKTELAVIHFIAWSLAKNPHCRFLHLSASDNLASLNSATAKEITELTEYQTLWPGRNIKPDSKAKSQWNLEIAGKTAGGVYATSAAGQVTGFRAGYMRDGFSGAIIIDDPLKAVDAWSAAKREAINRIITNAIRSRRALPTTPIILIMQRLHEDDPAAHALAGDFAVDFHHLEIQAVQDEGGEGEISYWENKESLADLRELRGRDPYTYYSQYQQRPTPPGGAMFRAEWFETYAAPPDDMLVTAIFADTALKTGQHNDYSVLALFGLAGRNVYLLDLDRGKWEAPELEDRTRAFIGRHRPRRPSPVRLRGMFIEDKSSGTGLIQHLRQDAALRGVPVFAVQRGTDKVTRAAGVLPYVRAGQLWVPESAPWLNAYIGELLSFSPALTHKHDDQVDVTCDALDELLGSGGMTTDLDMS